MLGSGDPWMMARLMRWWRQAGWGRRSIALLGMAGVGFVIGSLLPKPGPDAAWLRDFLMTVGASMALFAPFYLITRSLDLHLDRVATDTAQQVEEVRAEAAETSSALTGQVEELRADVDRRIDTVLERVTARLEAEAEADRTAIAALRTEPNRETVWDAFVRARTLGLVSPDRPPRVNISDQARLYVSVEVDMHDWADEPLQLRIENLSGRVEDWIPWPEGRDAEEVLVEVGRALFKHTGENFNPARFLGGLADLLEAALSHPERRPAIEICPPQWMVCEWGVITYDGRTYGVSLEHLQTSNTISGHVAEKRWINLDSWDAAYEVALALFPPPASTDPWATPSGTEPPF